MNFIRKYWKKALVALAFIPLCVRIFLRWTPLAIGLAMVPIEMTVADQLVNRFGLGQVSARLISFTLSFGLLFLAWHVGEIIVVLMAWSLAEETFNLYKAIDARWKQMRNEEAWATA